jgi:hypothetical protein
MSDSAGSIILTRRAQMFPTWEPEEIDRLRRFGETRSFGAGEYVARTGEVTPGMVVILSGEVVVSQHDELASPLAHVKPQHAGFAPEASPRPERLPPRGRPRESWHACRATWRSQRA